MDDEKEINEFKDIPEGCAVRNDLLGLVVLLHSNSTPAIKLLHEAERSLVRMINATPTRRPLGVG